MAPVYVASRLLLSTLFIAWLFLYALLPNNYVESLTYDRQTLLDIRSSCVGVLDAKLGNFDGHTHRTLLRDVPAFLRRLPLDTTPRKRRRRRRKRGGVIVRIKTFMRAGCLVLLSSLPRSRAKVLDRFTVLDRPTPVTCWLRKIVTDPPASTPASPDSLV